MDPKYRSEVVWIAAAVALAALILGVVIGNLPRLDELASRYAVL